MRAPVARRNALAVAGPRSLPEQAVDRELQYLGPGLVAVLGGDEVAADHQRVGQHAADLDVVPVRAELPEQRADVPDAPVVDPAQPFGDVAIAARPVPDR